MLLLGWVKSAEIKKGFLVSVAALNLPCENQFILRNTHYVVHSVIKDFLRKSFLLLLLREERPT